MDMTCMRATILLGSAAAAFLAVQPAWSVERPPYHHDGTLNLRCGAVWDAKGGQRVGPISIKVREGRIASLAPDQTPLRSGEIDLRKANCLPGMIDAHTHIMLESDRLEGDYDRQLLKQSSEYRTIVGLNHARRMLAWGFTSIRDLGSEGAGYGDVAVRDAINNGLAVGPRLQVSTLAISATSAYPLLGYAPGVQVPHGAQEVTGPDEGRRAVRQQIADGADLIKLYADRAPREGANGTILTIPTLTLQELQAMVDEAHRQQRKVAVNSRSAESARAALAAGADSIEHGDDLDDEDLRMMVQRGVFYVPDFDTDPSIASNRVKAGAPVWGYIPKVKCKTLAKALAAGVRIAFGSGIGGADWAYSPTGAFGPMAACGMTPEQVLTSATLSAAELMGVDDRVGTLEPGKLADIIAVPGDPMKDMTLLGRVVFVAKGGVEANADQTSAPSS
jgi:imidazolonepropionase-like amidohydrolase